MLIAEELGWLEPLELGHQTARRLALQLVVAPTPGGAARKLALMRHRLLEALQVQPDFPLGGDFGRQLDWKPVGVVQLESIAPGDHGNAIHYQILQHAQTKTERLHEPMLLALEHVADHAQRALELRVCAAHHLGHSGCHRRHHPLTRAHPLAVADRAADDASQHVATLQVRGHDAVGEHERDGTRVVGHDAQAHVILLVAPVDAARELLGRADQAAQHVGVEH